VTARHCSLWSEDAAYCPQWASSNRRLPMAQALRLKWTFRNYPTDRTERWSSSSMPPRKEVLTKFAIVSVDTTTTAVNRVHENISRFKGEILTRTTIKEGEVVFAACSQMRDSGARPSSCRQCGHDADHRAPD